MNQETILQYWQQVQEITQELEPGKQFSTSQVVDYLNEHLPAGSEHVTKTKVNYLRLQKILNPLDGGEGKERINWRYTSEDVRRALLVELLKTRANLSVQASIGWLRSFEERQKREATSADSQDSFSQIQAASISQLAAPAISAYSLLRNRVLGILMCALGFVVDGGIPTDCLIAIRPLNASTGVTLLYDLNWEQASAHLEKGIWFLAASETYSKLYMYPNLKQLQERRNDIASKLATDVYDWRYLILEDIYHQRYETILGLLTEDTDTLHLSSIISKYEPEAGQETDSKSAIQLKNFPGLSTLLSTAFVKQPDIPGGTPLSALLEIIANTSDMWHYCAILVPEYRDISQQKWLHIQEHSSGFPTKLKNKQIEIGNFLTGWCYKYNQSIVVDSTIDEEPRIAFFEEEGQPTAAAAIPATASGQHTMGVLYIGSYVKPDESQKVFSEELLACLEVFGYICGDMISRDQVEIETVRSAGQLATHQATQPPEDLRSLMKRVVDEALQGVNLAEAIYSWIYLLTLNIQATSQDTITQWLCEQAVTITEEFLANRICGPSTFPSSVSPLPVEWCKVRTDRYAFAILCTVNLAEEKYKQKIAELENELNQLKIGDISPRFYLSTVTFRYEVLRKQLHEKGVDSLVEDLAGRTDERLKAGLSLKRGHEYLHTAQPGKAAANFEEILRYAPNNWYAFKHIAQARVLQGTEKSIAQAIEKCQRAVELNPDYASAHCLLADCLSYQGRFGEAFVHYEKAIALDSTRHDFLTRYALTLASMDLPEYQDAIAYLKSEMPDLFQQSQYLEKPWEEAITRFGEVRDLMLKGKHPNSPEAQKVFANYYYHKGCAYLQATLIDDAIDDFIMGRKHGPDNINLAQAYSFALSLLRRGRRG